MLLPERTSAAPQPGSCAIAPEGCCRSITRLLPEVMTSRAQAMFSFQVEAVTTSRSSRLLAMAGRSDVLYWIPSLLLPLTQAQGACPAVTEYVPYPPRAVICLLVIAAR